MKDDIESALKTLLNAQNAFRFLGLAYQFELRELKAVAATLVQSNFMSEEISANMEVSIYYDLQYTATNRDRGNTHIFIYYIKSYAQHLQRHDSYFRCKICTLNNVVLNDESTSSISIIVQTKNNIYLG